MNRRIVRSVLAAGAALALIWVLGGPVGAALNAPGLLALDGARRLGVAADPGPSLRVWLWLATGVSALLWGLAVYATLAVIDRKARAGA